MNTRSLFPTPVSSFPNFITSKERLQIIKSIKNIPHHPHDAIGGDGLSSHYHFKDGQFSSLLDISITNRIQNALDEYNIECGYKLSELINVWTNIQNSGS